jgi:hypothetical protein
LFVALVFIVCLNMFIGIVSRAFLEVHDDVKTSDRWKISAKHWEADVVLMIHRQIKGASEAIKAHFAKRKRASMVTRSNASPSNGYLNGVTDKEIEVWRRLQLGLSLFLSCVSVPMHRTNPSAVTR